MMIRPNIGILNALIRITLGLTVLAWSTAKLVKRPWRDSYLVMALLGAMKVAEGIVRYCPLTALYKACPVMNPDQKEEAESSSMDGMEGLTNLDEQNTPFAPF